MIILVASATVENAQTHKSLTRHSVLLINQTLIPIDLIPALKDRAKVRLPLRDTRRRGASWITDAVPRRIPHDLG